MMLIRHRSRKDKRPLHYTLCGLDDVYLLSGYEIEETEDGTVLSISDIDDLHRAIGLHLVMERKVLGGKDLRFLRKQLDLTQAELGHRLRLSDQQVARWEKGQSEISGPADTLLRFFYLQHAGQQVNVLEFPRVLEQMDAPIEEKALFERTDTGWHYARAA